VCFGIEIPEPVGDKYSYKLIFNNTGPPSRELDDVPDTTRSNVYQYKSEYVNPLYLLWKKSGFLVIQNFIDNLILRKETGVATATIDAKVYPIKSPEHVKDTVDVELTGNFGPILVLPMILSFLRLTSSLLIEKEKKIREGMKIMGMKNTSFYLSWIITYMIILTVISLLVALGLKIAIFKKSGYFFIFIWFWLFAISLIF